MKHFVYIIKSISRNRYYIGYTIDIERRVREHNAGSAKSTRPFGPWKLIYSESFDKKSDAYKREYHLKHAKGRKEKSDIIANCGRVA